MSKALRFHNGGLVSTSSVLLQLLESSHKDIETYKNQQVLEKIYRFSFGVICS